MGSFEVLSVTVASINFRFIGNFLWTVNTVDSSRLRLPFNSDPKGVKREVCLKKYMTISATPAPEKVR